MRYGDPMGRSLDLGTMRWEGDRPRLLGVVNVTPDSFSDGGRYVSHEAAIAHGLALLREGADALDVGGESTRPGAESVPAAVQIERVVPVIAALVRAGAVVSVDTTRAAVAVAAFDAGARILNDVGMGDGLEQLAPSVIDARAVYLRMHSRGTPKTMRELARYDDVVTEVIRDLLRDAERLQALGVPSTRIWLDPGVGFAKTAGQSLELLRHIARFCALGYPTCVGPSRKSFIDAHEAYGPSWKASIADPSQRVGGTAAAVSWCVAAGADVLRVHDVATMAQAARVAHELARGKVR